MRRPLEYEKKIWRQGKAVAGADEVGRGALAGPIVAAVVLFKPLILKSKAQWIKKIKDSKKLSPKMREHLYKKITRACVWATASVSNNEIDKHGIQPANILVINKAVEKLKRHLDYLLVDYVASFKSSYQHKCIAKGDQKVFSIACASIVAKVYRDSSMVKLHKKYPRYNFFQNKGYGSLEHRRAIRKFGISLLHRKSFNVL
ncbi:MAG: Ribonuclease HII [candidate division CPR1 bacterium GW2011_GWA2_42_17]|uniref:Ribonuclease HII n=1 Tax=candidate division CPR1 bacterium GW2011_GWA2_42_17 TaxID=1618341 RepID=A0A0G1BYT2_9BACT|nr:MAG: Ribonuclease HII [candidate division CPR1 bacterium GW2011_GWA2_42_17]